MAKASNNDYPSILVTEQAAKPTAPATGKQRLYMKTDHKLYHEDSGGTETEVGAGVARSGSTTDGHLAVWNGSNADSLKDGGTAGGGGDIFGFGTLTDPPAIVSWSTINTSSGWAAQVANNKLHMRHTGQGGDVIRGYYRAIPVGKIVTCAFLAMRNEGNDAYQQVGLFVYDSVNTKFRSFALSGTGNWYGYNWNASGVNAGGGTIETTDLNWFQGPLVWEQIDESSSNRVIRVSPNGVYWIDILSEAKNTYITDTTHVGFGIYDTGTQITVATLAHWVET